MFGLNLETRGFSDLIGRMAQAPELLREEILRGTEEAAQLARAEIVSRIPVRTGALRDAVQVAIEQSGDMTFARIGGQLPGYAKFVEFGTKPHDILARNARALRFTPAGGSGPIFRRSVHHPGTKGVHAFSQGAEAAKAGVFGIYLAAVKRAALRIVGR